MTRQSAKEAPLVRMGLGKVYRPPVSRKTGLAGKCLNGMPRDSRDRGMASAPSGGPSYQDAVRMVLGADFDIHVVSDCSCDGVPASARQRRLHRNNSAIADLAIH